MRLLRRNLLSIYTAYAAGVVSGLVVTPIAVHALGTEGYGIWAFIASAVVFLGLLDLGLGPSVVRFAALQRGRGAVEETNELVSTALVAYGAVALLTIPLGVGLAWLVPVVLDVPADDVWAARVATLAVVAGIALRFPLGLGHSLMQACQRYDVVSGGSTISLVLLTVLVAILLPDGGGIVLLAALTAGATVVRLLIPALWVRRELPELTIRRDLVSRRRLRDLLGFSSHNFLIHLAARVLFSADVVVVGLLLGARAAAFYAIPARLFTFAYDVAIAGTGLLFPAFSELEGRADDARQRLLLLRGLRLGAALVALLALPLVLIPDQLIRAWIGDGFEESTAVAVLLGIALIARQPVHLLGQYLIARGLQRRLALVSVGAVAVNVALSLVLAPLVGLWGVAAATLLTEGVAGLVLVPRLAARASGLPLRRLASAWVRPLAPVAAVALVVLVGMARALDPTTLLGLAPVGLAWVAAAAAAVWLAGIDAEERAALAGVLRPGAARVA